MADENSANWRVAVNGIPESCGLHKVQPFIAEAVDDEDGVVEITYSKDSNGMLRKSSAIVLLKKKEYVEVLMKKAVIEMKLKSENQILKITRVRPSRAQSMVSLIGESLKADVLKNHNLQQFSFSPDIDNDIIEYVKGTDYQNELIKTCETFAQVKFEGKSPHILVWFQPNFSEKSKELHNLDQDSFEKKCIHLSREYFSNFKSQSEKFDEDNLATVRKQKGWNQFNNLLTIKVSENQQVSVMVRWNPAGNVKLTGLSHDVRSVVGWLRGQCKISTSRLAQPSGGPQAASNIADNTGKHQVSESHPVQTLKDYEYELHFDSDIVEYVMSYCFEFLTKEFENTADVELDGNPLTARFKPFNKSVLKADNYRNQRAFERDCSRKIHNFFGKFSGLEATFEEKKLDDIRKLHKWSKNDGVVSVKITEKESFSVFVRWNVMGKDGKVKVVGLLEDAVYFLQWLRKIPDQNNIVEDDLAPKSLGSNEKPSSSRAQHSRENELDISRNSEKDVEKTRRSELKPCTLFCRNIPMDMYNEKVIRRHFGRFGVVTRVVFPHDSRRCWASVAYASHDSAVEALNKASYIKSSHQRLIIEWEKKEAERLRCQRKFSRNSSTSTNQPSEQRERDKRPSTEQITPMCPMSWRQLLEKDTELFSDFENRCILVQSKSQPKNYSSLRCYFEDASLSGGGPIEKIYCLIDGVFIAFRESEDAKNVVQGRKKHQVDDSEVRVYFKPVPSVYSDRFIIEGKFKTTSTIKDLLDCCDDEASFSVEKIGNTDSYIVSSKQPFDIEKVMEEVEEMPLEDVKPKTSKLCYSDCVKVTKLKKDVRKDDLKLAFMNKKKTGGGGVTMIQEDVEHGVAYVYFADFKVAERVANNLRNPKTKLSIKQCEVDVELCHHCPSEKQVEQDEGHQSRRAAKQFDYVPEIDYDIIEFIKKSPKRIENLDKEFENLAKIDFIKKKVENSAPSQATVRFKPAASQKMKREYQGDHVKFEAECIRLILRFFQNYNSQNGKFEASKLQHIRSAHLWNEECDVVKVEVDPSNAVEVLIRWNNSGPGSFKVVGAKEDVASAWKWLHNRCDITEKSDSYTDADFRAISGCGILSDIKEAFEKKVAIKENGNILTFKGLRSEVDSCRIEILKQLQSMKSINLSFLDEIKKSFLLHVLSLETKTKIDVVQTIEIAFRQKKIKAALQYSEEARLQYNQNNDLKEAKKELDNLIQFCSISVKTGFGELLQSSEWKTFEQELCSSGALLICNDRSKSCVVLVGLANFLKEGKERLHQYVNKNAITRKVVQMRYPVASYLSTFPDVVKIDEELKDVEWHMTSDESGGILVKGKAHLVKKASTFVSEQAKLIESKSFVVEEPGMADYFHSDSGEQYLKTMQASTKCIILVDTEHCPNWNPVSTRVKGSSTLKPLITVQIPSTQVNVNVYKNDITEHCTDAIVNASNKELELRSGGVSGCILSKGGGAIQKEMTVHGNNVGGELAPGCAVTTTAGHLPCKKIIHAVGPQWNSTNHRWASQCLKDCVQATLYEAEKHELESIAIPAISSGVFGGDAETCVCLILQGIVEHCKNNKSTLKQIDLVEMTNPKILEFFKKDVAKIIVNNGNINDSSSMKEENGHKKTGWSAIGEFLGFGKRKEEEQVEEDDKEKEDCVFSSSGASSSNSARNRFSSLNVCVKQGDLLKSDCDVIVNLTGKDFNLTGGQLSAKLLALAGHTVNQECQNKPLHSSASYRVTSGGNLRCKRIVHLVSPGNAQEIVTLLKKVFALVDKQMNLSSIGIPAIGTGNIGLSSLNVAQAMRIAIEAFSKTNPKHLKRIDVIIFQTTMVDVFKSAIMGSSKNNPGTSGSNASKFKPKAFSNIPKKHAPLKTDQIELFISSIAQLKIDDAWQRIKMHVHEKSAEKSIEGEAIALLDNEEEEKLLSLESKYSVKIRKVSDRRGEEKIIISGLTNNVIDAFTAASEIIQDYKDILTCNEYVAWKYLDPKTSSMQEFSPRATWQLDKAYKKNDKGSTTIDVKVNSNYQKYSIDFHKMTKTCTHTGESVEIGRCPRNASDDEEYPKTWNSMSGQHLKKILISRSTAEYTRIVQQFTASANGVIQQVIKLERIQNTTLYKQFIAQKKKVEARFAASGHNQGGPVNKELFHGTSADICEKISKDGFDRSFAATAFGSGVYFATTSNYSNGYSQPDPNGEKRMFLADVITGLYCLGNAGYKAPPSIPPANTDLYDSVVDNMRQPSIYVVFKDASVYPLYLLTYT